MAKSKSETVISKKIAESIEALGFIVTRIQSGIIKTGNRFLHMAKAGTPDRIFSGPNGLTIWCEVKKPDGELSEKQIEWHKKATDLGHNVIVVTSAEEAISKVKELMNENDKRN